MTTTEFLRIGPGRLRIDHWHDGRGVVVVAPEGPPLDPDRLDEATERLAERGIRQVLTAALDEPTQQTFLAAGFVVREELRLLRQPLESIPSPATTRLRTGRWARDLGEAAAIDHDSFGPDGHLDVAGLCSTRRATPTSRFRLSVGDGHSGTRSVAYAVSGFSAGNGYLQRLAVAPEFRRSGLGTALVVDALHWFRKRRAGQALVNTEVGNDAALGLYLEVGFVPLPTRLAVLTRCCEVRR